MNGYTSPTMTVLYHDQIIKTIHRKTFWRIKILKEAVFVVCEVDWQIRKQNLLCWPAKVTLLNPLNANPTKWANTLKQFVGKLPMNCLSVFDHFVKFTFKGLTLTLSWRRPLSCGANQWTGFYMITASVMKELPY